MIEVTYPAALIAGLISFISPCVLPLVPPYLCFLAGTTFEQLAARQTSALVARREILTAIVFVLGFTTVFVALGAGASAVGGFIRAYSDILSIVAGVTIIAMGLHFLGLFRIPILYRTLRIDVTPRRVGFFSAYAMGLAFAFGWTPCIGPVLAAILAVAASENTVTKGASLLAVYSLGLGVPFVIAAFALGPFVRLLARVRGKLGFVEKLMGGLLVLTGIAFLTGMMSQMSYWLLEKFPLLQTFG